jgi:CheY-like chemotaxis protein/HPt (histidine-containing phosphotransfer) domain-containing protein
MNGIFGVTELALASEVTAEQRDYLALIRNSADALLTVINDLLDFSKIGAGQLHLDPIPFSLFDSLDHTLKVLALRADEKGLELIYHIDSDVPPALVGDPGRLTQVVGNLIGAAIKFTERGEVVLHVERQSSTPDEVSLHFTVTATSSGLSDAQQGLIVKAFTQASGAFPLPSGSLGLGLTISKQLVQMMGGHLWVDSAVGAGSIFHFTATFGLPGAEVVQRGRAELSSLQGLRVLIVDDNATYRRILAETLAHWQMQPVSVASSEKALEVLEHGQEMDGSFGLVLLDAVMPGLDGFALAERIKWHPGVAEATIMMLTASGQRGDAVRCRELGIASYLTKPIKQSELLDAILTVLGSSSIQEKPSGLVTRHSLRESRQRRHILLVTDNRLDRQLLVRLLENQGQSVVVAGNGREVLATIEREPFDLILMDIEMPEMDGLQAATTIRQQERQSGKRLPIVAMTARDTPEEHQRCLVAGLDGYISKPIRADDLLAVVEGLLLATTSEVSGEAVDAPMLFDRSAALSYVDGDMDLLREMAELFLADYPEQMAKIQAAIANNDSQALMRAAHSLKGVVGTFAAKAAYDAALRLEMMGESADLLTAREAYTGLEAEILRLAAALSRLGT